VYDALIPGSDMITRAPFTAGTAQAQQFESGSVGWSPNTVIPPWSACAGTADLLITREWAILAGENDYTTDTFQHITGRPNAQSASSYTSTARNSSDRSRVILSRPLDRFLASTGLDLAPFLSAPEAAMYSAFWLEGGSEPDWFLVSLAVLSLLAEVAAERPLVCVVDDAQCLDKPTCQVLSSYPRGFVTLPDKPG
jgi:hypothetical protein